MEGEGVPRSLADCANLAAREAVNMDVRRYLGALFVAAQLVVPPRAFAAPLVPLAVADGRCESVLATEHDDDQYLLILGCLSRSPAPQRILLSTATTTQPEWLPLAKPEADPRWRQQIQQLTDRQARARLQPTAGVFPPLSQPPPQKVFHLFVKDDDFHNPASYVAITANLHGVGRHCQVYVDRDHADTKALEPAITDAIRTFDNEVFPRALGQALDVDRDGRFTILFSGWLAKLQNGKVNLSGFLRGSDFYRDLPPPLGNRCDMMYLSTDLKPGPFLRTLIAHEYTHGVVFSEHVFGDYLPCGPRQDEESWLNEALAHLVEDQHGYSWGNLDYRVSAYLSAPERYALVVPDYYASKLWRDPGTRGCTYLFLRWCVDRFGPGLLGRLVRSNLSGVANLEAATQTPFEELFRHWSAAQAFGGSGIALDNIAPLCGIDPRDKLGRRRLCGPHCHQMALAKGQREMLLAGTGVGYVLLHSPAGAHTRLTVTADPKTTLQVSLVRLPRALARLELDHHVDANGDIRLTLQIHHAAVQLDEALWESLVTQENADGDTSYLCKLPGNGVRQWFGHARFGAGETRPSAVIRLPVGVRPEGVVFKVTGVDDAGYRVSGWHSLH
jgi:hypothetical protein